ncbi:MAG: iron-containing alcohol dehydrogenase [Sandaracinaceae bacterium]
MADQEPTVISGWGSVAKLAGWLREQGVERALLLAGPTRRFVDEALGHLAGVTVDVFDGAEVHVPREVVSRAEEVLRRTEAQAVVALGGGSSTGLGKALRLQHDVRFVAVPTTYAGSERTRIYGITEASTKSTGRDDRVRPDLVVLDPTFTASMPLGLTVKSLLNALAHPVSALSTGELEEPVRASALRSVRDLVWTLEQLLENPADRSGRERALRQAGDAAAILDRASLGVHHRVAHLLGGRFGLDHAGLHSVLLPHTVRRLASGGGSVYPAIAEAAGHRDLPAVLYDALSRAGAPRSLAELGVEAAPLAEAAREHEDLQPPWVEDAFLGRRPSVDTRRHALEGRPATSVRGPELKDARRVVLALHGRGANADRYLRDVETLIGHDPTLALVAPQAPGCSWYDGSHRGPREDALDASLRAVRAVLEQVLSVVPAERVLIAGFSQGACLGIRLFMESPVRLGGLVALSGADMGGDRALRADVAGVPVLLGVSAEDPWVQAADTRATAERRAAAGARVENLEAQGGAHEMTVAQRLAAQRILTGRDPEATLSGFGHAHASEALAEALPLDQNSPRQPPFGLHAEQVNGTGFVARRHENLRSWLYRVRPSAQHTPFAPLEHPTFRADFADRSPSPNLAAWAPLALPAEPTDWLDGLTTVGGAGSPDLRRGYAVHVYAANRSMEHRAFYDADGDLLLVPQEGRLLLQTELGVLPVGPMEIAIIPRGLKVSVQLLDGGARGYVGEIYGRHFDLPERGPVGANGLTDARHFRVPTATFEDRLDVGYRLAAKLGNRLYEARQDHSPYDAVAWHGNYVPYVYDLRAFSPVGNTRFDHPDPSIYTVLSAPLDEQGAHTMDFVFFPPRWDPTEHTLRPPYFHRNATMEINGIIADPSMSPDGPFEAGMTFVTPTLTAHGVLAHAVERAYTASDEAADKPMRMSDRSAWFQFETTLPMVETEWAREHRLDHWPGIWGSYRTRFDPRR